MVSSVFILALKQTRKSLSCRTVSSADILQKELKDLLDLIGRPDLMIEEKASFQPLDIPDFYKLEEDEIDDELIVINMPEGWKRCYRNPYLKERGFTVDDYTYFPVGTTERS